MDIRIREEEDVTVAVLTGEITGRTDSIVQEQLLPLAQPECKILLDMSGVTYMSSAGLRLLLILYRRIAGNKGRVVLIGLTEMVRDTMSITGFLNFFATYKTFAEGVAALNEDVIRNT